MKLLLFTFSAIIFVACQSGQTKKFNSEADKSSKTAIDTIFPIKTPENSINDSWSVNSFVDDFGEKSNDSYIETDCYGSFSNSATSDEYLKVKLFVTTKNAGLFLHEYNDSRPAEKFIGTGKIRLRNTEGKDLTIYSYSEWNQTGGLKIENDSFKKLRDFLLNSKGQIKAVVFDDYSSVYNFSLDADSFDKHFAELKASKPKN